MTKEEKQELASKSFVLGVEWTLKMLTNHQDLWNVDEEDAKIIIAKAKKLMGVPQEA